MNMFDLLNSIIDLLKGIVGLLIAVISLIVVIIQVTHIGVKRLRSLEKRRSETAKVKHRPTFRTSMNSILPIIIPLAIAVLIFGFRAWYELPLDTQLTKQAWDAYNNKDYKSAVSYAEGCIDEFQGGADRKQRELEHETAPVPPIGGVPVSERRVIFERGLLNAVATCFYIKGRSLETLGQKQEAIVAYREVSKYTYARCWDPKIKIFWSPAEAALDRLQLLEK